MRKISISFAVLFMLGGAAQAQCTPDGMARFRAADARLAAVAARIKAGDCSLVPEWKRALGAVHAILRRSQQQTVPYTCNVQIKYPAPPKCGNGSSAQAKPAKPAPAPATQPAAASNNATRSSSSCSDITGTGSSAPAATHCKNADRALYAARQIRKTNPKIAATEYKKAATAARRAGDTTLELTILREAADPDGADSTVEVASNPAEPPPVPPPAAAAMIGRLWDGRTETCETAKELERATAGWYYQCVLLKQPRKENKSRHQPNPDPKELGYQARQACGSYSRDTQQCFSDFKLKVILEKNPGLREACEKKASEQSPLRRRLAEQLGSKLDTRQAFLECVDDTYLYGPDGSPDTPTVSLRDRLREKMYPADTGKSKKPADARARTALCSAPGRCCPPGQGMKPTPGAFGAWSCQKLGVFSLNTKRPNADSKDEEAHIDAFEDRLNGVVANSVAAAIAALGSTMSESEREACEAAALAADWSAFKGGAPAVPEQCRAMAGAAVGSLPYYADSHVDNSNDAMEDLLASFRSDSLQDAHTRNQNECVRRGGTVESCLAALTAPPAVQPPPQPKAVKCGAGEIEKDGGCVAKTCPAGQSLDSDGDCVRAKAKPKAAARRATSRSAPENKGSGALDCSNPAGLFACANRALSTLPSGQ